MQQAVPYLGSMVTVLYYGLAFTVLVILMTSRWSVAFFLWEVNTKVMLAIVDGDGVVVILEIKWEVAFVTLTGGDKVLGISG